MASIILSNTELVNIAINIEKKGIAFYDVMSRSSEEASVREIFRYLAGMERRHVRIFRDIFNTVDKSQSYGYDIEYSAYVRSLMDNSVFTEELADSELVNSLKNDAQALELGIMAEKDSIIFYYEMRDQVADSMRGFINRIIAEEKSHLKQLSEMKKKIQPR